MPALEYIQTQNMIILGIIIGTICLIAIGTRVKYCYNTGKIWAIVRPIMGLGLSYWFQSLTQNPIMYWIIIGFCGISLILSIIYFVFAIGVN